MVKITNPLGDVKIGRQGEAVYQLKYGEQIRRMVSPKRAIASEAQEKHRQRYRDALAWRKQLSLANRRYLDGYCNANGIVDDYHIPLPWSRFALKLYLEHVKFVPISVTAGAPTYEDTKFEGSETGDTVKTEIYGTHYTAQSFKPSEAHNIKKVKVKLWRKGTPGTLYVGIKETDGAGKPTGADICSGTIDGNSLTTGAPGQWYEIELGAGANLLAETTYAIVLRIIGGSGAQCVCWRYGSADPYPDGLLLVSTNSGGSWTPYSAYDNMFEVWGTTTTEGKKLTLIHVRHPALLAVIQKRGELTIRQDDTLSSLDDEYLTKQVGLDLKAGDTIEATTVAGISYKYQLG